MVCSWRSSLAGVALIAMLAASCTDAEPELAPSTTADLAEVTVTTEEAAVPLTLPEVAEPRQRGGSIRVGIWIEPEPTAPHVGGDIVRALTEPQLFTARPGGGWAARLVEPGSVVEDDDVRRVTFRLREGARWSDGSAIDAGDLRRTADRRFVDTVTEGPDGTITVRLFQPLPGWRRLWSGVNTIEAPSEGMWGGPFRVHEVTPGLETVLVPNDDWWGVDAGEGPWVDELRLVVVPDQTTMLQLFERGELDVVAPWPVPGLREYICDHEGCTWDADVGGGWQAQVVTNPEVLDRASRRSMLTGLAPEDFVGALLKGEARSLPFPGFEPRAPEDVEVAVTVSLAEDVPLLGAAARGLQLAVDDRGGLVPELRVGPSRLVSEWAAADDFQVLLVENYVGPSRCWSCQFGELFPGEAELADAGDPQALLDRLAADAIARPLWVADRVVAWSDGVQGVEANAWSMFVTWNAWQWSIG